jgi:hypothetical protein
MHRLPLFGSQVPANVITTSPPIGSSPCLWQEGVGHMGRMSVLSVSSSRMSVMSSIPSSTVRQRGSSSSPRSKCEMVKRTGLFRWYCCELSCSYRSTIQNFVSSLGSCMTCQSRVFYQYSPHHAEKEDQADTPPCLYGRRQQLQ